MANHSSARSRLFRFILAAMAGRAGAVDRDQRQPSPRSDPCRSRGHHCGVRLVTRCADQQPTPSGSEGDRETLERGREVSSRHNGKYRQEQKQIR